MLRKLRRFGNAIGWWRRCHPRHSDFVSLYWRMCHLLLILICLHEAPILALQFFSGPISIVFFKQDFFVCTSATAAVELCSPGGKVPWIIVAVSLCVLASSRATTLTVSVWNIWVCRMHVRLFSAIRNANFARTSVSKPYALGLRFLKGIRSSPLRSGGLCGLRWICDLGLRCGARGDGERVDRPHPFSLSLSPEHVHGWICALIFIS